MKITENIENTIVPNDTKLIKNENIKNPNSCGMCITCIGCKQAISDEELAIEKSIADAEAHYERTWNLACGDDF